MEDKEKQVPEREEEFAALMPDGWTGDGDFFDVHSWGKGEQADIVATVPAVVVPQTCYVSKTGRSIAPYRNWEDAATNIVDAVDLNPKTVLVADGTYLIETDIAIRSDLELRSVNGPEVTIVDAQCKCRDVWLTDQAEGAVVDGFTFMRGEGYWNEKSHYARVEAGTLSHCILSNCSTFGYRDAAVLVRGKGRMTDCVVDTGNMVGNAAGTHFWGTVVQSGGVIERCTIQRYNYDPSMSGGDSGSFGTTHWNGVNDYVSESNVGASGGGGAGGTSTQQTWTDGAEPYSKVPFKPVESEGDVVRTYRFLRGDQIEVPLFSGRGLLGWRVSKPAEVLPGHDDSGALTRADVGYHRQGDRFSPSVWTYGDAVLAPWRLWVLHNGQQVPIDIPTGEPFFNTYLKDLNSADAMSRFLNDNAANGLKVWQDYVLGLDHTNANATVRIAAEPRPDGEPGVRIRPIKKMEPRANTGFSVSYQLASPGAEPGAPVSSQEFDVGLPKSGGRYRLGVQIKADSAGNAADVIPATNEVGVVRVEGGASNVVVAVPFAGYDGGQTTVSNLLPSTAIPANTELFRCADGGAYERWTRESTSWTAQKTFSVDKMGTREDYDAFSEAADRRQVANGTGLWLSQKNGNANAICLFGSVPTNGVAAKIVTTVTNGTAALVANPHETGKALKITDAAAGDTIQLPTSAGPLRTYRCRPNASGQMEWASWENGTSKVGLPEIPAGTGFWYVSMGLKEVKISWE